MNKADKLNTPSTRMGINMTEGSILKALLWFAFPILIGNIFQQFYNIADTVVLGNILGDEAIASVGAVAPIYTLVISFSNGMTNGFSVIIARFFGAGDKTKMGQAITLSYFLTVFISVLLTVLSLVALEPLLRFIQTPENVINDARGYIQIILIFSAVTMLYNMFAGMFRAIGNSRVPLYVLVAASFVNVGLDLLFVGVFNLGVEGAAYATIIAQGFSVLLCVIFVVAKYRVLLPSRESFVFKRAMVTELSLTGLSMALMLAVVSIGSIAMQNAVNSLGSQTVTAHTAARKFDDIFMLPLATVSLAASTFASQNYGAGRYDRVRKGIATAMKISFIWSLISLAFAFLSGPVVKLLTGTEDEFVVNTAVQYIMINVPFFFILSILITMRSSLQGIGRKVVPLLASVIELIMKFAVAFVVAPILGYMGICVLEPAVWFVCSIPVLLDFLIVVRKERKKAAASA